MFYILLLNNGESYEDFQEWNAGVFVTKEAAEKFGKENLPKNSYYFNIEKWDIKNNLKVKDYQIEVK